MTVGTFASHDTSHMNTYLTWAAIAAGVGIVTNFIGFQTAVRHEAAVRTRLVTTSLERLLAKDHEFFANQKIGALTGKFIDFINSHIGLQDLFVIRTLSFTINLILGVVIIYMQTPLLAWIIIGLLIGLGVQIRYFRILREPIRAERKRLIAEVNGSVADTITNNLTVKTFAQEKYEVSLAQQVGRAYEHAYVRDFKWLVAEGTFLHAVHPDHCHTCDCLTPSQQYD
jgi:ABC-type multidrug transport system fused ATPase/permease subunit